MANDFEIKGAAEVLKRMREFAPAFQRRGLRRSARRAMTVVRDAAKANARAIDDPNSPQQIWKQIAIAESSRQSKQVGGVVMRVGVRGGARKGMSDVWHWRLLEFGTQFMRARPFMRPALENNTQAVSDRLVTELNRALDEQARDR
jgi:HK97 gp10 family phage protein